MTVDLQFCKHLGSLDASVAAFSWSLLGRAVAVLAMAPAPTPHAGPQASDRSEFFGYGYIIVCTYTSF